MIVALRSPFDLELLDEVAESVLAAVRPSG